MVRIKIRKSGWKKNYTSPIPPSSWSIKPVDWVKVDELIDRNYLLKDIAKIFNLSPARFSLKFIKQYGTHFSIYKHKINVKQENLDRLLRKYA